MLRRGDTIGVFQLEGGPVRALLRSLAPTTFEDIAALVALYRPGPMAQNWHNEYADRKNGAEAGHVPAPRPRGDPRAHVRADDLPGAADARRAAARRLHARRGRQPPQGDREEGSGELIAKERSKFVDGCVAQGHDRAFGEEIFDTIEPFADYSFNKSHSVGYGYLAYQTAYLKANHPVEYLAALLTSVKSNKDQTAVFLNECRQLDIPVLVPDVNESEQDFTVRDTPEGKKAIRYGLSAVRNVGEGVVALIVARPTGGRAVHRLLRLLRPRRPAGVEQAHGRVAGEGRCASTRSGTPRKGLVDVHEQIDRACRRPAPRARRGDHEPLRPDVDAAGADAVFEQRLEVGPEEYQKAQRLAFEKEMLGLYVSDHPLLGVDARAAPPRRRPAQRAPGEAGG